MAAAEPEFPACASCGATIYPEHLQQHKADRVAGRLLCPHCLIEQKQGSAAPATGAAGASGVAAASGGGTPHAGGSELETETVVLADEPGQPIQLIESPEAATAAGAGIRAFTGAGGLTFDHEHKHAGFRRELLRGSPNATRCRTFHTKLTDASLAHLNDQINEWVDEHDDVEIKFVSTDIGVVEGKHADPHLIVTVFY
jgi:hypothetical protein